MALERRSYFCEPLRGRPADVPYPAKLLEHPDHSGRDVDLPREDAVSRRRRIGVVQVVPGFSSGQDRHRPEVRSFVTRLERSVTDHVADGVYRPGDVMQE